MVALIYIDRPTRAITGRWFVRSKIPQCIAGIARVVSFMQELREACFAPMTWQWLNTSQASYGPDAFKFVGDTLFAGFTYGGGVLFSTDLGDTWISAKQGLTDLDITSFGIKNGYLFAGSGNGIWRRPLSEFSGVKLSAVPLSAGLSISTSQDNNVHLEFQEENNSILQIEFFDVLGRRVASYPFRSVAGLNRVSYPLAHVASGTYVCRISGNQTMSKRFSIVR
jgi:hypothetical protein